MLLLPSSTGPWTGTSSFQLLRFGGDGNNILHRCCWPCDDDDDGNDDGGGGAFIHSEPSTLQWMAHSLSCDVGGWLFVFVQVTTEEYVEARERDSSSAQTTAYEEEPTLI